MLFRFLFFEFQTPPCDKKGSKDNAKTRETIKEVCMSVAFLAVSSFFWFRCSYHVLTD